MINRPRPTTNRMPCSLTGNTMDSETSPSLIPNSSFSLRTPGLQLGLDSTSLGEFKQCPRKYQLSIVEGWQEKGGKPDLEFGIWLHQAREEYEKITFAGAEHEEALQEVLGNLLKKTWDLELDRPWTSTHPVKNRTTLVQTVIWYLDEVAQGDHLETVRLASGAPAVELSFRFDSGLRTRKGESILLCGHLDRIASFGEAHDFHNYVVDIKTTKSALNSRFFSSFSPDNQMSLYTIAGEVVFGVPIAGVIIDGIQVGVGFARFARAPIYRAPTLSDEWLGDLSYWLRLMEHCADAQHWPMNDKSCGMWGGCQFREVCGRSPGARDKWLKANYTQRTWDPLLPR